MNVIEEAARRIQQLERAGIRVPWKRHSTPQQVPSAALRQSAPRPQAAPHAKAAAATHAARNFRNIDFARLQAAGFITPKVVDSPLLNEFRLIKRSLIQNALGRTAGPIAHGNLTMVTSSLPGEGKSFVALNLALSIAAEVDSTVLLVDADVVAPALPKLLGIQPDKGLMDVLSEPDLGLGDVLLRTNIPRLALLLAGTPHRGASEWLASDAMTGLLKEISSRYPDRIVLFDSPPLLATTESRVLASRMGQVLVVVEAERTTHGVLESALSTLEACPAVMMVLNKANESDAGSYYGYYGNGR